MKRFLEIAEEILTYIVLAIVVVFFLNMMHDLSKQAAIRDQIDKQIELRNNTAIINYSR